MAAIKDCMIRYANHKYPNDPEAVDKLQDELDIKVSDHPTMDDLKKYVDFLIEEFADETKFDVTPTYDSIRHRR